MNSLADLHDAFAELERQGKAAVAASAERRGEVNEMGDGSVNLTTIPRSHPAKGRGMRRFALAASVASIAAVLAVGGGVVLAGQRWSHDSANPPAASPAVTLDKCALDAHGLLEASGRANNPGAQAVIFSFELDTATSGSAVTAVPQSVLVAAGKSVTWSVSGILMDKGRLARCELERPIRPQVVTGTGPLPISQDALANRFRTVLGKSASITSRGGTVELTFTSVGGLLTADGQSGNYGLAVGTVNPDDPLVCQAVDCQVNTLPDGSTVRTTTDSKHGFPGVVSYEAIVDRPDGLQVALTLDNYPSATSVPGVVPVTHPEPPLTVEQLVAAAKALAI